MSGVREAMARAMQAQGKVDPDEVFAEAEAVDLDEPVVVEPEWQGDEGTWEPLPIDPEQEAFPIDEEERGYGYEP